MLDRMLLATSLALFVFVTPAPAEGQSEEGAGASDPAASAVRPSSEPPSDPKTPDEKHKFTASGYIEAFYQYNFNNPSNRLTNYRGFDNLHNTVSLSNAVL